MSGEGPRARSLPRPVPSLTPGSLDWSMLTSAMSGGGPGGPWPPASPRPPAPSATPRGAAAPDAAQSPAGGARGPGGGRGTGERWRATKAAADRPRRPRLAAQLPRRSHLLPRPRLRSLPNTRGPEMDSRRPVRRERGDRKAAGGPGGAAGGGRGKLQV